MGIADVFSKRGKPLPDVYQYDEIPRTLRVQLVHILKEALDPDSRGVPAGIWDAIARLIAREHGLLRLPVTARGPYDEPDLYTDCLNYMLKADAPHALDLLEVTLRQMARLHSDSEFYREYHREPGAIVAEVNHRFQENGSGYQYEGACLVRLDSQVLHAEAVKPALALLSAPGFEGPSKEFVTAHEHFRHGRVEAAMTEACKAFESTLKAICDKRRWSYDKKKATANTLIQTVITGGLVPSYSEEQLQTVQKGLLGVATLRNKDAGHGAGAQPRDVPEHYAAYALHLAASNIVFLVECHKAMK